MRKIISKIKRQHVKQVLIYGTVGFFALVVQIIIYLLLCMVRVNPLYANIVGAIVGIFVAYHGHVKFTFEKKHKFSRLEFIKYAVTAVIGMVFNSLGVDLLINMLKFHSYMGVIPMILTPGVTFIINKFWSFR